MDNYHITKKGDQWKFIKQGNERSIASTETKAQAIEKMQEHMKTHPGSVKIHKENGRIQEDRTYPGSIDPKKSPGQPVSRSTGRGRTIPRNTACKK